MRDRPFLRALTFTGLGMAGLVGGHAVGYAIAVPDATHRAALLGQTGHAWMPGAAWLALIAGLAALVSGVASGYVGGRSSPRAHHRVALTLGVLLASSFVSVEVIERLAAGASLSTLSPALVVVGIATQFLCAFVIAIVVGWLRRAGAFLASTRMRRPASILRSFVPARDDLLVRPSLRAADQARAPPAAVVV